MLLDRYSPKLRVKSKVKRRGAISKIGELAAKRGALPERPPTRLAASAKARRFASSVE
jgi:hypothetical protein